MSYLARGQQVFKDDNKDEIIIELQSSIAAKDEEISRLKEQVKAKQGDKRIEQRKKTAYYHDRRALIREKKSFQATDKAQKEKLKEADAHEKELQTRINRLESRLTEVTSSPGVVQNHPNFKLTKKRSSRLMVVEPMLSQLGNVDQAAEDSHTSSGPSHNTSKPIHKVQEILSDKLKGQLKAKDVEIEELRGQLVTTEAKLKIAEDHIDVVERDLLRLEKDNQDCQTTIQELRLKQERLLQMEARFSKLMTDFSITPALLKVEKLG